MATTTLNTKDQLVLGWQMNSNRDPQYWIDNPDAKPGSQTLTDLVWVPANTLGAHVAIIAQSGSGKSFFLGRLIEELLLRTRARCVILDPNADFRKVYEVEDELLWDRASYNVSEKRGRLPHEASRQEFESQWSKLSIRIRGGVDVAGNRCEQLRLWWPSLDMQFLAEDVDPMYRSDLYHCHAFVKILGKLLEYKLWATGKSTNLIDAAQRVFRQARGLAKADLLETLQHEYNSDQLIGRSLDDVAPDDFITLGTTLVLTRSIIEDTINRFIEGALTVSEYVSAGIERFYFGKAREYQGARVLQTDPSASPSFNTQLSRLEVIDLPSLPDKNIRLLAINALLSTEWDQARREWNQALAHPVNRDERVPTFIVVDEAHNLIPAEPRTKAEIALGEQFRTIVAEGRKYGLFLIVVSQRPDKLDPLVLSECENKAIMKLGSANVLDITKRMLGLEDISQKLLDQCLAFETGRVLLIGRWAPKEPMTLYSAARRTVEGGRNLRDSFWASPPDIISLTKKIKKRDVNFRKPQRTKSRGKL